MGSAQDVPKGLDKEIQQSSKQNNSVGNRKTPFLVFIPPLQVEI